jgi:hypothetical protein
MSDTQAAERPLPLPGERWRDRDDGEVYTIVGAALIKAPLAAAVVYRGGPHGLTWVLPLDVFLGGGFEKIA